MKRSIALILLFAVLCTGCEKKDPAATQQETYTYNYALATFPTNWNPNSYRTSNDSEILDYISDSFYVFDYNEDDTGFSLQPGMADDEPEDVTEELVGQYGIKAGDRNRAYVIELREDLRWEDGTPAHTIKKFGVVNRYDLREDSVKRWASTILNTAFPEKQVKIISCSAVLNSEILNGVMESYSVTLHAEVTIDGEPLTFTSNSQVVFY